MGLIDDFRKDGPFSQIGKQLEQLTKEIRQLRAKNENVPLQAPSLTTAQRNALSPMFGMIIYNSTTGTVQGYTGSGWSDLG